MKYTMSIFMLFLMICVSCDKKPEISLDVHESALIPIPKKVRSYGLSFVLNADTKIGIDNNNSLDSATELSQVIHATTGKRLAINITKDTTATNTIYLIIDSLFEKGPSKEQYSIQVNENRVIVRSPAQEGLYRGTQTLKQLLPLEGLKSGDWHGFIWAFPGCEIHDTPAYAYRGAMLDVARHFFKVSDVKRFIDLLSLYKINTLHLHLADDQGWRIEIKSWPQLTEIGGSTAVGGGKGGYYTQEDYKDIIAYASQKHMTVIPEIDMPGHTNAALASYPALNCDGKVPALYTGMRVGFSSLCVDKEITYTFVEDVIRELSAITPGDYIHLGGDESHVTSKEDYNIFLQKVFPLVRKYDKQVMGWEDIESAGIATSDIIQHWTSKEKAIEGAKQGAKIVLSPAPYTYLDMKYNDSTKLGLTWAGTISINKAYNWEPSEYLEREYADQIIGIESPLWTETVKTIDDIEYMAFPRIIGHAELGWHGRTREDVKSYATALKLNLKTLDKAEVNYYKK